MVLKIAWRNLFAHKNRSLMALLSIMSAFAALSLFEGYLHDVARLYEDTFSQRQMLGHIIIEKKSNDYPGKAGVDGQALGENEQAWIDAELQALGLDTRVRFLNIKGLIVSGRPHAIFIGQAYDLKEGALMREPGYRWNSLAGLPLDESTSTAPIVLGRQLADVLGCAIKGEGRSGTFACADSQFQLQVGTESAQANAMDFELAGIMASGFAELDSHLVMLPLEIAQKLYDTKRVSYVTVRLKDEKAINNWVSSFNEAARRDKQDVLAQRWQDHSFGSLYRQSMDFLNVFRNLVITILLSVVCMSMVNTFVKIVSERMREIGTMRSIGYRPLHIMSLFCCEAFLLALVGSGLGIVLSYLGAKLCNMSQLPYNAGFLSEDVLFRIALDAKDFVWITALIVSITIISTLLPAWRSTRARISEILAER